MEKPKIVAVKHKTLQRPPLTELEKSLAEEIRRRGEELPPELGQQLEEEKTLTKKEGQLEEGQNEKQAEEKKAGEAQGEAAGEEAPKGEETLAPGEKPAAPEEAKQETMEKASEEVKLPHGNKVEPTEKEDESKPKIIARREYAPAAPARQSVLKVQEDIVREMREQASRDVLPVRKEIGKPFAGRLQHEEERERERADEIVRELEEQADPEAKRKKVVDEAIRKFEEKEGEKSLVKRVMKKLGFR